MSARCRHTDRHLVFVGTEELPSVRCLSCGFRRLPCLVCGGSGYDLTRAKMVRGREIHPPCGNCGGNCNVWVKQLAF
jgi:hypothetical protein